jgi:hypothetical protein
MQSIQSLEREVEDSEWEGVGRVVQEEVLAE